MAPLVVAASAAAARSAKPGPFTNKKPMPSMMDRFWGTTRVGVGLSPDRAACTARLQHSQWCTSCADEDGQDEISACVKWLEKADLLWYANSHQYPRTLSFVLFHQQTCGPPRFCWDAELGILSHSSRPQTGPFSPSRSTFGKERFRFLLHPCLLRGHYLLGNACEASSFCPCRPQQIVVLRSRHSQIHRRCPVCLIHTLALLQGSLYPCLVRCS